MAIQFDAAGQSSDISTNSTWGHTVGGGGYMHLLCAVTTFGSNAVLDQITYAGTPLSLVYTTNLTVDLWNFHLYELNSPPSGTANMAVIHSGASGSLAGVSLSYSGVDKTTPRGSVFDTSVATTDISLGVTSALGEVVVDYYGGIASSNTPSPTGGQTLRGFKDSGVGGATAIAGMSDKAGDASVILKWSVNNVNTKKLFAVSLKPAIVGLARAIKYFHDINDPLGRIFDDLGRMVPPWELRANNWIRVTGLFSPTSSKYTSFTQDPELAYIEEVSYSIRGGLRIKTNRGELTEVLLARAAGGKTL